jgi:NAD+ diphosphatase
MSDAPRSTVMPFSAPDDYVADVAPPGEIPGSALWFVFRESHLLVAEAPQSVALPEAHDPRAIGLESLRAPQYLGRLRDAHLFAAEVDGNVAPPAGWRWEGLRALFGAMDESLFALAGRALQVIDWDRTHQFCGRCGAPTAHKAGERSRECPRCGLVVYPRLAPAVMAMVRRLPDEVLLARSPRFPPGMYSALAGFVEPGETLEQCLEREVLEEVGVHVRGLRYFASQPWPFPHSLMIAFVCDWESGEVQANPGEIEAAGWFNIRALPRLPNRISIARRLIDTVVRDMGESAGGGGQ